MQKTLKKVKKRVAKNWVAVRIRISFKQSPNKAATAAEFEDV